MGKGNRLRRIKNMRMIRTVEFNDQVYFATIRNAITFGGQVVERKSMTQVRLEASILDKLDTISTEDNELGRKLKKENETDIVKIQLEEQEYQLIKTYFDIARWDPNFSRKVVEIFDWFVGITQTKVE